MQRWIASVTLFAYLVGGWVLPAVHHHGGTASLGGHHCVGHLQAQHEADQPSGPHVFGCDHSHHGASAEADSNSVADPANVPEPNAAEPIDGIGLRALASEHCTGLCALCVARTLASQRIAASLQLAGRLAIDRSVPTVSTFCPERFAGDHYSRGPPSLFV